MEANEDAEKKLTEKGVQFFDIDRDSVKKAMEPAVKKFDSKFDKAWLQDLEDAKK